MIEFHIKILKESLQILKDIKKELETIYSLPIDEESYLDIKKRNIKTLDTLAYRFSKIQSILGEKVFREILEVLGYDLSDKSYIDLLQFVEKEKIIPSIIKWKELREIRNTLSHDYPEETEFVVNALNKIIENIDTFEKIVKKIEEKYEYANKIARK
jgi:DNA repair ATPase RecN